MMDMPMKDGMEKKEMKPMFKCPNCDCSLEVMPKKEPMKDKMNAGNMPMGDLKSKIQPPSGY